MESDWRYNVAAFGMAKSNWKYCARLRAFPDFFILVAFNDRPPGDWYLYFAEPIQDPFHYVVYSTGNGPGNFPHGWDVLPD